MTRNALLIEIGVGAAVPETNRGVGVVVLGGARVNVGGSGVAVTAGAKATCDGVGTASDDIGYWARPKNTKPIVNINIAAALKANASESAGSPSVVLMRFPPVASECKTIIYSAVINTELPISVGWLDEPPDADGVGRDVVLMIV